MLRVKFVLVCEGPSDRGLVRHLEALCVRAGASEAIGDAPDLGLLGVPTGNTAAQQVRAVVDRMADVNLVFVHRDADAATAARVRRQLEEELHAARGLPGHVLVVPVQELEAWLLVDPQAIREVAGNPRGTVDLNLPGLRRIEATARPKERLRAALMLASEAGGRALARLKRESSEIHRILLERLDIDGPVTRLRSWRALVEDIESAVGQLGRQSVSQALPTTLPAARRLRTRRAPS